MVCSDTDRSRARRCRRGRSSLACFAVAVLGAAAVPVAAQDYRSSVVGTDFDFIHGTDENTFSCLEFRGRGPREMPDKTRDTRLVQPAFIFVAYFVDGTRVDIAIDADFETEDRARTEAQRFTPRLGVLPTALRRGVERLVVHRGGRDATAFSDVGLIVVYSDNATARIGTHDLEETVFHESVHAAWDRDHAASPEWRAAQQADGGFVTRYAENNPDGEDLAESALFAYTLLHHPERIPAAAAARIRAAMPNRIAFVAKLLPPGEPVMFSVGPRYACDGSGATFTVEQPAGYAGDSPDRAHDCDVDISEVGGMSDILSNALVLGLGREPGAVRAFLADARGDCSTGGQLVDTAASAFGIERAVLDAQVQEFLHCNCDHGELTDSIEQVEEVARVAPATAVAVEPGQVDGAPDAGAADVRGLLYAIVVLLALVLLVNAGTLAVLFRRG